MAVTLYYMSGSPYAWRVWLSLEHKGVPFELKTVSYDAGDLNTPAYIALNPRRRIPVLVDDGFALYESAAIVEYIADKWLGGARLLAEDRRARAIQRRKIREADQYAGAAVEGLVESILFTPQAQWSDDTIARHRGALKSELARWEPTLSGDYLAGPLSAVDFTLFPYLALVERMGLRRAGLVAPDLMGPRVAAWMQRMKSLPVVQKTWPPHWK